MLTEAFPCFSQALQTNVEMISQASTASFHKFFNLLSLTVLICNCVNYRY
jgi:hypothetical protein